MRYLTFALAKGGLARTMAMFEELGITCEAMKDKDTRKLIFVNEDLKLKFFSGESLRCADLCGIWRGRYWCSWRRHDFGRRAEPL